MKKKKKLESDPPTLYTLTPDRPPTGGPLLVILGKAVLRTPNVWFDATLAKHAMHAQAKHHSLEHVVIH